MTVGTFEITNPGLLARQDGSILPDVDTMVAVLVDDAHTVNLVTDTTYADISANESASAHSFAEMSA